jgi:hypothetical protein
VLASTLVVDSTGNYRGMSTVRGATIVFAALIAAGAFPGAARAECSLENVASAEEIAAGWTIHEDHRIVKQMDGAPYEQGGRGNWFIDRETTTQPMCSVFDDLGAYSLRSYMLQPAVAKAKVQICQATADGGSVRFVSLDAKPRPPDTAIEVYEPFNRPYLGSCPPRSRAPNSIPRSKF